MDELERMEKEVDKLHKLWHSLENYLKKWYYQKVQGTRFSDFKPSKRFYREVDFTKVFGWKAMQQMNRFIQRNSEIIEIGCDDNTFSSSSIYLIPHKSKKRYMGTTVLFIPQIAAEQNVLFLYPEHLNELIKALQKLQKIQRKTQ